MRVGMVMDESHLAAAAPPSSTAAAAHKDMDGTTTEQLCCLIDDKRPCLRTAGNASYGKKIQKTVQQRKLKLETNDKVCLKCISVGGW